MSRPVCGFVILGGGLNPRACERRTERGTDRCEKHREERELTTYCAGCFEEWPCTDARQSA